MSLIKNTKLNKKLNKKGFTLIEVLIATSIFVLTMVVLSQIFINVMRSEKLAYALLDSESIIRNNLEYMARAIRMGTKFNQISNSQICFLNSRNENQCFYFENNSLNQSINGVTVSLIDSSKSSLKIYKGSFYLYNNSDPNKQPIIRIQIWAQTEVKGDIYDFKVETAVTPRTLNISS
ncbi:MAG: PulJ/GspJ family protein [Minisyncoccia bacterium]